MWDCNNLGGELSGFGCSLGILEITVHSGDSMVVLAERQSWLRLKNTFVKEISAVK